MLSSEPSKPSFGQILARSIAKLPNNPVHAYVEQCARSKQQPERAKFHQMANSANGTLRAWLLNHITERGSVIAYESSEQAVSMITAGLLPWMVHLVRNLCDIAIGTFGPRAKPLVAESRTMELDLYVRRPERFHGPRGEENKPLGKNSAEILRVLAEAAPVGLFPIVVTVLAVAYQASKKVTSADIGFDFLDLKVHAEPRNEDHPIGTLRLPFGTEIQTIYDDRTLRDFRELIKEQEEWWRFEFPHEHGFSTILADLRYRLHSDRENVWQMPFRFWTCPENLDGRMRVCYLDGCGFEGFDLAKCAKCKIARYCSETHQRLDWPRHRQFCHEPGTTGVEFEPDRVIEPRVDDREIEARVVKLLRRLKVPDDAKVHALEGKFDERPVLVIMDDADKKILGGWFMDDGTSIPDDGASSWSTSSEVDGLLDRLSVQSDLASSEISHAGEIADVESGESESENAGSTELSSDEETEDTEHEEDA